MEELDALDVEIADWILEDGAAGRGRQRIGRRIWSGAFHRTEQHMAWLRKHQSRNLTRQRSRRATRAANSESNLRRVFNEDKLGQGHKVLSADDGTNPRCGGKTWDAKAVQKRSYLDIRRGVGPSSSRSTGENALGRTQRTLDVASSSSRAHSTAQSAGIEANVHEPARQKGLLAFLHCRYYDATPKLLMFKSLAGVVGPHARYFIRDSETGRWKSCTKDEYCADRNICAPGGGVVEILAQRDEVAWARTNCEVGWQPILVAPRALQSVNASTTHAAVESGVPELTEDKIIELAKLIPYVGYSELPDCHPANRRKRAKTAKRFEHVANVMVMPLPGCFCHIQHRHVTLATGEQEFVGDLHAVAFSLASVSRRNAVLRALWDLLSDDEYFVFNQDTLADPAWSAHTEALLRATIGRKQGTLGRLDRDGSRLTQMVGDAVVEERISKTMSYINGDIRDKHRLIHYERSCGKCSSKEEARNNVYTALVEGGIVPDVAVTVPSKARIGTTMQAASQLLPSRWAFQLISHLLDKAFPTYLSTDRVLQLTEEQVDPYDRTYIRNKMYRSKITLRDSRKEARQACNVFALKEAEWLWARLQHLDETSQLLDLIGDDSDITHVQKRIAEMVTTVSDELQPLFHQYENDKHLVEFCELTVFESLLTFYVLQWWRFEVLLSSWPWLLLRILLTHDKRKQLDILKAFFADYECELEPLMAAKIRRLFATPEQLLSDKAFMSFLRLLGSKLKICNMHCERLLSLIDSASVDKTPSLEAYCSKGFLTQWVTEHIAAGGTDVRVMTKASMQEQGVLFRTDAKEQQLSRRCGGQQAWNFYAQERDTGEDFTGRVGDYHKWLSGMALEFRGLNADDRAPYIEAARSARASRSSSEDALPAVRPSLKDGALWGSATQSSPLDPDVFLQSAYTFCGKEALHNPDIAFRQWGTAARQEFQDNTFVRDNGHRRLYFLFLLARTAFYIAILLAMTTFSRI